LDHSATPDFIRSLASSASGAAVALPSRMGFHTFEEIGAWQRAFELNDLVSDVCNRGSFDRDQRLRNQLRDAARSGPSNIAEGFGRWKHGDFAKFVRIAKASEVELLNHFKEALKSRHITREEKDKLDHAARKALKAANGLIRWLEENPDP
jgi:four helix bundle protein